MIETKAKYCLNNNHSIFPCSFSPAMVRIDMSRFSGEKYDNWHKLSNFNIFLPSWMTRPRPLSATIKPGTKNSAAALSNNSAVTHVSNVWQSLKTTKKTFKTLDQNFSTLNFWRIQRGYHGSLCNTWRLILVPGAFSKYWKILSTIVYMAGSSGGAIVMKPSNQIYGWNENILYLKIPIKATKQALYWLTLCEYRIQSLYRAGQHHN